ncbi:MAG: LysR family transcriptional regulator, partial [Clostridia bacterium]|nr:LysR family transcriptional regulator [Clostridia bacterium]
MDVKYKIWIDNDGNAFGFGTYYLLEAIDKCGSLSQAAKILEMSYSRAHSLLKQAGLRVGFPLIESQAGGAGGGITAVTPKGKALMKAYK